MKEITFDETPPVAEQNTISEAWSNLIKNPSFFIRYWNYKGAILSGILRAPIFLVTYLIGKESFRLALGAALVQFIFRFFFAGISGALIQVFRRVEPAWKALVTILLLVPLVSHIFEFLLQVGFAYVTETGDLTDEAIIRSICVSVISALFTLFVMRRNVLIVREEESNSLFSDIKRLPLMIFQFVAFIPNEISYMFRRGAFLTAILSIAAFGIFAQMLLWAVTNKTFWTYGNGKHVPFLKYWGIDGILLLLLAVIISSIVFKYSRRKNGLST